MPLLPVALYGLEVPAGDAIVPAVPDFPATFRITMAAIDPSAPPDTEGSIGNTVARATLKLIRQPIVSKDDDGEEDSADEEYMRALLAGPDSDSDGEDGEEEEEANGGPSDPAKSKKARKAAALGELLASIGNDSDDEMEDAPNGTNGLKKADKKGKAKATGDEEDDDSNDDSDDSEEEDIEIEEFVICTLDPEKTYQQALDITIGEDERVFFKVSGTHAIHLTGNYVIPDDQADNRRRRIYDSSEDEEDEYDFSPDEDELELELEDDESDDLDALDDPRIAEVESEEEAPKPVTKAEKKEAEKKGKNKRPAEELEGDTLDDLIAKSAKPVNATTNGEPKLSKKQLKKMKNNSGEAVTTKAEEVKRSDSVKDSPASNKGDKKVQFAKDLEQGPTGSAGDAKTASNEATKAESKGNKGMATLGVKTVKGVKIDDKKLGTGPAAKKGDRVGMRYIGKLTDGKVFDSNKKGKAFSFKLGAGEVIQGWDIGVVGMSVGGERRLTIPANLAYGNKSMTGIPANSTLVFDVKLLEIK